MATIHMDMKQFAASRRRLAERFMPAVERGLAVGGERCVSILQRVTDDKRIVNLGGYKRGWASLPIRHGVRVFNHAPYAAVIEEGRRRGARMPPLDPIARWFQRKRSVSETEARGAAYPIARAIGERGLPAHHVLRGALPALIRAVMVEIGEALRLVVGA